MELPRITGKREGDIRSSLYSHSMGGQNKAQVCCELEDHSWTRTIFKNLRPGEQSGCAEGTIRAELNGQLNMGMQRRMDEVSCPHNLPLALPYYQNSGNSEWQRWAREGTHREQTEPYSSMPSWSKLGRGEAINFDLIELVNNTLKLNTSWKAGKSNDG